jgi:peptidyl-prolyl cis-trans isomerase SurA
MKSFSKAIYAGFATLALSLSLSAQAVVEEIVARVNDSIITKSDLQRSREQLQQEIKQDKTPNPDLEFATREKNLLRDLIDQKLLVQEAKDQGISVENDVIKRLDEIRKQNNLESMEDLEKAAKDQGISFEDFKDNMRNTMLTQRVIGSEVGRRIQLTPAEVTAYYNEHKQDFKQPESVRLSEILVSTEAKPNSPAPDPNAAEAKAKSVLEQIKGGAKFEEIAKKSSDDASAAQGGDLGFFKRGDLSPEIEKLVYAMQPGQTSDVIRTKQGFILLKVTEHKPEGFMAQKDAEEQIQEKLYYEKLQPAVREYLTHLREDAYIDIKPGFVDSGASKNQTKPIVTAANTENKSGESGKKTKKKKKLGVF